jgi:alkanesulfonate monooxygenase SsuD/methylene tetrahydromethanopterin reductase-like flavin-dependent oxidoreductase (luciferase family)
VYLRVPVYIADTEEKAREEPKESVMFFYKYLGERIEASAGMVGARAIENRAERGARLQQIDYDEVLRSKIIAGTPAMVVDRLGQVKEELGLDGILAELNCGMRIPNHQVLNSLNLLCQEVRPKFQN